MNFDTVSAKMGQIANNRYLTAIRDGMSVIIPVSIIGSFFTILLNLPIDAWKNFIQPYAAMLSVPMYYSINLMAIYCVFSITSHLAKYYKIDPISTSVLAEMSFFILAIEPIVLDKAKAGMAPGTYMSISNMGAQGLFTAILCAIFTVEIVRFFTEHNLVIKMPDGVPAAVGKSFSALLPGILIIVISFVLKELCNLDINKILIWIFSPIGYFGRDTFLSAIVPVLLITIIWLFGVHGMVIATPILYPYWYANLNANVTAVAHGHAPVHFMTEQFFQWFVWVGGAGATLSLAILLLVLGKSKFSKTMGAVTIVPAIFNINEPLIFGIPIIMNPYFAIPFVLAPTAMAAVTYVAMKLHLVAYTTAVAPWTLPGPIGAWMATGFDWRAIVLCLVNILISLIIYYPFFKMFDNNQVKLEKEAQENEGDLSLSEQN
ncbi:MAG: PTS sugar transporter subunit IIC [Lactobacillus panisapium]|uniref:Permease IIC component n=1 Tax=Lactobacillus panisapium TaxID=2012495 RepID=A0ABX8W7W1_9LACO|nr:MULTISPECIES: PTS transporter subunit EIIC [Lactobacillus]MCT6806840.1 PTS transporter subunit EIIC [Bombilactobacillus sp.]MCO6531588.1 PTS sugar transporter subunit IIC [Lactobacillus sp.]MCO6536083.1 PTS sugar transporter subunit IIC [Lactobacillus sp.]MCT6853534.1 PTS transporter subunit EIIC [Lactobacillus panisapium]MCX8736673.1 PTS sugar transporter subunit IIC [Lactobacillus sp. B4026]